MFCTVPVILRSIYIYIKAAYCMYVELTHNENYKDPTRPSLLLRKDRVCLRGHHHCSISAHEISSGHVV